MFDHFSVYLGLPSRLKHDFQCTILEQVSQMWWCTTLIPEFERLRLEVQIFKATLGYVGRTHLKKEKSC